MCQRVTRAFLECPRSVFRVSPATMENPRTPKLSPSLLEPLVDVVAAMGELVATVAGMDGVVQLAVPTKSLQAALVPFMGKLHRILCLYAVTLPSHPGDTSKGHCGATPLGVTLLGQALAKLGATPGDTWDKVVAAASAWKDSVVKLRDSWAELVSEATELYNACGDAATAEATTAATAKDTVRDLQDKIITWKTAGSSLVATAWQLPMALDKEEVASAVAAHEARVAAATSEVVAATKAMEEAAVAASQARAATVRGQRAEVALRLLPPLVAACAKATVLPWELLRRLRDIEATLEVTKEASPNAPQALVAAVAEAEQLWEASASLIKCHLLGTFRDIKKLLSSSPGGPSGDPVDDQCKKAIKAIPELLQRQ